MVAEVQDHKQEIAELCRRFKVRRLDLFGSAAKGGFRPLSSDLDFIVLFLQPGERGYARRYYNLAQALENLFQRPVDLLTEPMIRNPYFREEVEKTRQTIYEHRGEEATI